MSAQLFVETFDDGNAAARWSAPLVTQEDPLLPVDSTVDYAFDYGALGIAPAPGSVGGTTIGFAFGVNLTDQLAGSGDETEAIGITPLGVTLPAGDFVFTADFYAFAEGDVATSEYPTVGVFTGGTAIPIAYGRNPGDGLVWQFDATGGSGTDIFRFDTPGAGEVRRGAFEDIPAGSIPGVGTGPKPNPVPDSYGAANRWVTLDITQQAGVVSFGINGTVIDTFDNTAGAFTGGTLLIAGTDPFDSLNADYRHIFDNVTLDIPEPASVAVFGLSLALLRRRS